MSDEVMCSLLVVAFLLIVLGEKLDDIRLRPNAWRALEALAGIALFLLLIVFPVLALRYT